MTAEDMHLLRFCTMVRTLGEVPHRCGVHLSVITPAQHLCGKLHDILLRLHGGLTRSGMLPLSMSLVLSVCRIAVPSGCESHFPRIDHWHAAPAPAVRLAAFTLLRPLHALAGADTLTALKRQEAAHGSQASLPPAGCHHMRRQRCTQVERRLEDIGGRACTMLAARQCSVHTGAYRS